MEQKNLPSPLHHHQIKSKFRMASFRSPKAAHCSDFVALIELFSVFSFLSIPLLLLYTVVVMTKPILVFSTETVGANTFSSADVGYFLASFQPFNTHWNSKAKVSSQHTCSKGQYQLFTLIPPPSDWPWKMAWLAKFVHHWESRLGFLGFSCIRSTIFPRLSPYFPSDPSGWIRACLASGIASSSCVT